MLHPTGVETIRACRRDPRRLVDILRKADTLFTSPHTLLKLESLDRFPRDRWRSILSNSRPERMCASDSRPRHPTSICEPLVHILLPSIQTAFSSNSPLDSWGGRRKVV